MTGGRTISLLLSLLLLAGPCAVAPGSFLALSLFATPAPLAANDEEDPSGSPAEELSLAVNVCDNARRAVERHAPRHRRVVLLAPRRHHAPAVVPLTPPAPFRATVNPPQHC